MSTEVKRFFPRDVIYVRLEGGSDPPLHIVDEVDERLHGQRIKPWRSRPDHGAECEAEDGWIWVGPCGPDDFMALNEISFPFWRVARVKGSTATCRGITVLVRRSNRWDVVYSRLEVCV